MLDSVIDSEPHDIIAGQGRGEEPFKALLAPSQLLYGCKAAPSPWGLGEDKYTNNKDDDKY